MLWSVDGQAVGSVKTEQQLSAAISGSQTEDGQLLTATLSMWDPYTHLPFSRLWPVCDCACVPVCVLARDCLKPQQRLKSSQHFCIIRTGLCSVWKENWKCTIKSRNRVYSEAAGTVNAHIGMVWSKQSCEISRTLWQAVMDTVGRHWNFNANKLISVVHITGLQKPFVFETFFFVNTVTVYLWICLEVNVKIHPLHSEVLTFKMFYFIYLHR